MEKHQTTAQAEARRVHAETMLEADRLRRATMAPALRAHDKASRILAEAWAKADRVYNETIAEASRVASREGCYRQGPGRAGCPALDRGSLPGERPGAGEVVEGPLPQGRA